jgi:uncharacterized BrkB/YihY/UPF0761 family membrane protein
MIFILLVVFVLIYTFAVNKFLPKRARKALGAILAIAGFAALFIAPPFMFDYQFEVFLTAVVLGITTSVGK